MSTRRDFLKQLGLALAVLNEPQALQSLSQPALQAGSQKLMVDLVEANEALRRMTFPLARNHDYAFALKENKTSFDMQTLMARMQEENEFYRDMGSEKFQQFSVLRQEILDTLNPEQRAALRKQMLAANRAEHLRSTENSLKDNRGFSREEALEGLERRLKEEAEQFNESFDLVELPDEDFEAYCREKEILARRARDTTDVDLKKLQRRIQAKEEKEEAQRKEAQLDATLLRTLRARPLENRFVLELARRDARETPREWEMRAAGFAGKLGDRYGDQIELASDDHRRGRVECSVRPDSEAEAYLVRRLHHQSRLTR